jgi:hypothetical protein
MDRLHEVVRTALSRAHKSLDLKQLVRDVYGDDLDVFGSDNDTSVLESILASILEQVQEQVQGDMEGYYETQLIQQHLALLDVCVRTLYIEETAREQEEEKDQALAHDAVLASTLPANVHHANDMVRYEAYKEMEQIKQKMMDRISEIEQEIAVLESESSSTMDSLESKLEVLQSVSLDVERAADSLSVISSLH